MRILSLQLVHVISHTGCSIVSKKLVLDAHPVLDRSCRIRAKKRLLQMHFESGVGHIGGNLSCLDLLLALYHAGLSSDDQLVLSKGHSAGALYVALWSIGRLSDDDLRQFHKEGTLLSGHPPAQGIDDILFGTGSLGHGAGLAAGLALGKRLQKHDGRVYCLTSDGEWNEGSTWESLIFAKHRDLTNLTIIVDENGLQGFGTTKEVADLSSLSNKFRAFDLLTLDLDGHDCDAFLKAIQVEPSKGPLMIVARTVKGRGVSFMENRMEWHYLPMNEEQFRVACLEVEAS